MICAILVNERLMKNVDTERNSKEGGNCSAAIMFIVFLLIAGANITWLIFLWKNFGMMDGCGANLTLLIVTTVVSVIIQFIVCFRLRDDASELTSAIVILYILFLQWSAFCSNPDPLCNPHGDSDGNATARLVINLVVTFIAMLTAASTVEDDVPAPSEQVQVDDDDNFKPVKPAEGEEADKEGGEENNKVVEKAKPVEKEEPEIAVSKETLLFHVLFVFASIYYSMLLTNWGSPDYLAEGSQLFGDKWAKFSFWIQQCAQWLTIIVYLYAQLFAGNAPEE